MYTQEDYIGKNNQVIKMGVTPSKTLYMLIGLVILVLLYFGYKWSEIWNIALLAFGEIEKFKVIDIFSLISILILILLIFWFSNREIKKSLEQARKAENSLAKDKEYLEAQVVMHLEKLEDSRIARMQELTKAAEFGRLSQGLFHDLMTPLTSVILHTEKLKGSELGELKTVKKSLEKAWEATSRMSEYIKDVRLSLQNEAVEEMFLLNNELDNVINFFAYQIKERHIKISTKIDAKHHFFGNPLKIKQIFSNLISNAIDSFDGIRGDGKTIDINISEQGNNYKIDVSDNGCGINKDEIDQIFNQFFTTKTRDRGTGIGLYTVKNIVEKDLHGKILVESKVDQGSCFTIIFPRLK